MIHIPKPEYSRRRKALMAQMEPNSIAILPAAAVAIRNRDVEHVYRQDSDFQYLSGFPEPQAVLVLMSGRLHGEYILFCRERNAERELWDGLRAGQEGAIEAGQHQLEQRMKMVTGPMPFRHRKHLRRHCEQPGQHQHQR